ncbi:helix-turn-helix domain-containing protein [Desulfovibrio fairfieldensis]|uniref:helix-turn-helix domain-containing protein n=1 Tax=Desulfovibrio fairfieldensis TaxID=44742 RepID=UPI0009FA044F
MITSNVKNIMADRKITIRALVALSGLSDKTVPRTRNEHRVECRLYTLQTIAKHLGKH